MANYGSIHQGIGRKGLAPYVFIPIPTVKFIAIFGRILRHFDNDTNDTFFGTRFFEKLIKAGFSKEASAAVLANLCEFSIIDDRRYAERMAERLISNNISKREALNKMYLN